MKILTIIGARPQFIKAAVISRAIQRHGERTGQVICEEVLHTGQHYDPNMSQNFFAELDMNTPTFNLNVGAKIALQSSTARQLAEMLIGIEEVIRTSKPDAVLVYGDTNSTLAGAIMAAKMKIPIIHIEAGVRNRDMHNVEEQNRIMTDHMSELLFCPTRGAVDYLKQEGIVNGLVRNSRPLVVKNVGDVMYDAYLFECKKNDKPELVLKQYGLDREQYILLTIHRDENVKEERLQILFDQLAKLPMPILFPVHPRTRKMIQQASLVLSANVKVVDPVSYGEMLALQKQAKVIVTDSGGVQKEAYFAQVPCYTIMEKTGWPETVAAGWNQLIDVDFDFVAAMAKQSQQRRNQADLFGQGNAGAQIVEEIAKQFCV